MDDHMHEASGLSRRSVLCGVSAAGVAAVAAGTLPTLATRAQGSTQATPGAGLEGRPLQVVYSFDAQFTGITVIGLVPEGLRMNAPFSGSIVAGAFAGGTVEGDTYGLIRQDGVERMEVRGTLTGPGGGVVSVQVLGYVIPHAGMEFPPLDALLRPDFAWPDIDQTVHGFALYETGVPELAWLNRTALAIDGTSNAGRGLLSVTGYAFSSIPELGAP